MPRGDDYYYYYYYYYYYDRGQRGGRWRGSQLLRGASPTGNSRRCLINIPTRRRREW